jgi:D-xylose 1-dehydrogenase (NADP+, D-xylono-1,5-lactone-forming)
MQTFKWGFVGAGMIAKKALYPAISKSSVGEIYAVASRDADRAMTISPKGLIYTDYDQMFADPAVDGVYISLPNAFHLPVAIKAMKAGKHVLCEKPLGMNAARYVKPLKFPRRWACSLLRHHGIDGIRAHSACMKLFDLES